MDISPVGALWGGLDTGGSLSRLTIIDDQLAPILDVTLPSHTPAILDVLASLTPARIANIAAEASSTANHLVRDLRAAGISVTLYDVGQVSRYLRARRNKTDANDARGLAEIAKLELPSIAPVRLKSPETQLLRAQLLLRHQLNVQRVACENALRSHLSLQAGQIGRFVSMSAMERIVRETLATLKQERGIDMANLILPLLEICLKLRRLVDHLGYQLEKAAGAHPICSRLLEVPGVGPICAVSFYTAVEDPHRFATNASIGPYLGLTPRILQSGASLRHGRISKMGNSLTRTHLTIAATRLLSAAAPETPLKTWGLRLAERSGKGKARTAVARRLAVILLAIWKTGSHWNAGLVGNRRGI